MMPLINGELDQALRDAGASSETARSASASVAEIEQRLNALSGEVRVMRVVLIVALGVIWLLTLRAIG